MKLKLDYRLFFTVLCILWVSVSHLLAQECGIVMDEVTRNPISGVHVYLHGDQLVAVNNEEGKFCLQHDVNITPGEVLSFSHVSYSGKEISLTDFKAAGSVLFLIESRHQLGEVTIHTDRFMEGRVSYKRLAPMKYGLYSFGSLLAGDYIYVMGGDETRKSEIRDLQDGNYDLKTPSLNMSLLDPWEGYNNRLFRYDIRNDRWEVVDKKFRKRAYHAIHHYDDKIYILGGKRLSTNRRYEYLDETVEIYDLKRDTVLVDPVNPHQAVDFASFMYDGNIIVMGGSTKMSRKGTKLYTNKVHAFDVRQGLWYELPPLSESKETRGVVVGSSIYIIGGTLKGKTSSSQIDRYDIGEGKMEKVGELLYEVERPAIAVDGNVIFLFEDGIIQTYNVATAERYAYQIGLYMTGSEMFCSDGKLYLLGGYDYDEMGKRPSDDLYCIDINDFNRTKLYTVDK